MILFKNWLNKVVQNSGDSVYCPFCFYQAAGERRWKQIQASCVKKSSSLARVTGQVNRYFSFGNLQPRPLILL
jgi:hypothetical protein